MSSTRGTKFLEKKPLDISSKVGSSDLKLSAVEMTPKITRNVPNLLIRINKKAHFILETNHQSISKNRLSKKREQKRKSKKIE